MVAQGDGEGTAEACPLVGPASKLVKQVGDRLETQESLALANEARCCSGTGPCMPHAISALSMCSIKDSMRQTVM